jgi:hypothetical protein
LRLAARDDLRVPRCSISILVVRSPPKAGVSNHKAGAVASSFETRFALLRMMRS